MNPKKVNSKRKIEATIAIILVLSMALIALGSLSSASAYNYNSATAAAVAAGMYWNGMDANASATRLLMWTRFGDNVPTHMYLIAAPNPVGQNEPFTIIMMNPQVPPGAMISGSGVHVRWTYQIDVTKPNGDTQTIPSKTGVYTSDSTGSTITTYTPDQVGNYTFVGRFIGFRYLWNSTNEGVANDYYGVYLQSSSYTLNVQVTTTPSVLAELPLIQTIPDKFWTRPIEGQNDQWGLTVASNWLSGPNDRDYGGAENRFAYTTGMAPNSPHIIWTRPTEDNGIVGGYGYGRTYAGNAFNAGSQYQPRFTNPIIMYGRLYYSPNIYYSGSSEMYDCVDLKTGALIWEMNLTGGAGNVGGLGVSYTANTPQFGYYYSQDDGNEHGIVNPGTLFSSNYALGMQPERGLPYLHFSSVPSGFEVKGVAGENLRYALTNVGNSTNQIWMLSQWNSTKMTGIGGAGSTPSSQTTPGNCPLVPANPGGRYWNGTFWVTSSERTAQGFASVTSPAYDWNITVTGLPAGFTWSGPTILAAQYGDILFGRNGSWATGTSAPSWAYADTVTVWAISLKPQRLGQLLYMETIQTDFPDTNTNVMFERASAPENAFVGIKVPDCSFVAWNMTTGEQIFETGADQNVNAYGYFTWPSLISQTQTKMAYGNLYTAGYVGAVSCYSLKDGTLVWRDEENSGGMKLQNFVLMEGLIADGKIYVGTHEHSADTPLYKGERVRCYNAYTGAKIFNMTGWAYPMTWALADNVIIYWNNYDAQVYALSKGPTALTVTSPDVAVATGQPFMIKGTVMDVSPGTEQTQLKYDFPTGLPAVSDDWMGPWMEYAYMQKAKPADATGVNVVLDIVGPDGTHYGAGAVSDDTGAYAATWSAPAAGVYKVTATFKGSESYFASSAGTYFVAAAAAVAPVVVTPTPTTAPTVTPPPTEAPTASPSPIQPTPPTNPGISTEAYVAIAAVIIIAIVAAIALILRRRK